MINTAVLADTYARHRGELVRYAARITGDGLLAEDLVQEAWIRLNAVEPARFPEDPLRYLYRTVRNLALDSRRRRAFEHRHFVEADAEVGIDQAPSDAPSPEAATMSREALRMVLEALEAMPERMRIAVEMHRFGGAKLKEIAARLDVSVTSAHELVAEGVDRCRLRLRRPG